MAKHLQARAHTLKMLGAKNETFKLKNETNVHRRLSVSYLEHSEHPVIKNSKTLPLVVLYMLCVCKIDSI